jgi:hypothetical protein
MAVRLHGILARRMYRHRLAAALHKGRARHFRASAWWSKPTNTAGIHTGKNRFRAFATFEQPEGLVQFCKACAKVGFILNSVCYLAPQPSQNGEKMRCANAIIELAPAICKMQRRRQAPPLRAFAPICRHFALGSAHHLGHRATPSGACDIKPIGLDWAAGFDGAVMVD